MNENDTITQIIAHKAFRLFLAIFLIALIVFALFYCNSKPQPINPPLTPTNQLSEIIADKEQINEVLLANNKTLRLKLDSLSHVKPKVIVRYKTVYDSLLVIDTMCVKALVTLHDEHSKIDSINNYIISNQANQISNYSTVSGNLMDIIAIQKYQLTVDSVNEIALKQAIQNEVKNGKRKHRKGLSQGCAVGVGIGVVGTLLLIK